MQTLKQFIDDYLGKDHFLLAFMDNVITQFGSEVERRGVKGKKETLFDHSFLSAHRLLDMIPIHELDGWQKNCILHAALAIVTHNYVDMIRKWKFDSKCDGSLSIGKFPICSLLAFCDCVQTWDREPDIDPALGRSDAQDGLLERLVLSNTSYISNSELVEFLVSRKAQDSKNDLSIRLRYFVEAADNVGFVCENLSVDINRWISSRRLSEVCDKMGLSTLLHGQITYELPILYGNLDVKF
jgi:hypothetical protein